MCNIIYFNTISDDIIYHIHSGIRMEALCYEVLFVLAHD